MATTQNVDVTIFDIFSSRGGSDILLVPWTENHLSSFKCGFLNIFSRQNLLCSFSSLLFLLRWNKNGAKKCLKNHIPFDFWDDSTSANQRAGKTIKKPLKELPWNQQIGFGMYITTAICYYSAAVRTNSEKTQSGPPTKTEKGIWWHDEPMQRCQNVDGYSFHEE